MTTNETKELATPKNATGLSLFDSGTFETMGLIAAKLSKSSLIPAGLKGKTDEETAANCFRVVEQAQRWGLSPFAVMDSASVVHGKLMWEGKLIHAAITSSLGCRLRFDYEGAGENRTVTVTGMLDGVDLTVTGTVKDWKTTGNESPWANASRHDQMLSYRGAREWARRHAPEVILGVYSPDEFDAQPQMRNVTKRSVDPFAAMNKEATNTAPAEPKHEPAPTETIPPQGRQTKERFSAEVTFQDVSAEKRSETAGKSWWTAIVTDPEGKTLELSTFSKTMAEDLHENYFMGDRANVTYTTTPKGGLMLEKLEALTMEEEVSK